MIRYILNYRKNYLWYKVNKDNFSLVLAPNIQMKLVGFCWAKGKPIFEVHNFGLKYETVYDYKTIIQKAQDVDTQSIACNWTGIEPVLLSYDQY